MRPGPVYGPGQSPFGLLARFAARLKRREPIAIAAPHGRLVSPVFVGDVVDRDRRGAGAAGQRHDERWRPSRATASASSSRIWPGGSRCLSHPGRQDRAAVAIRHRLTAMSTGSSTPPAHVMGRWLAPHVAPAVRSAWRRYARRGGQRRRIGRRCRCPQQALYRATHPDSRSRDAISACRCSAPPAPTKRSTVPGDRFQCGKMQTSISGSIGRRFDRAR